MKCQACGKNLATTHVKTIINGELSEYSLCSECAQKMGYGSLLTNFGLNFNSLLGSFFGESMPEMVDTERCPGCGSSFDEIARLGMLGCAECYRTFYDRLMPSIQRIHGNTRHSGKRPFGRELRVQPEAKIQVKPEPAPEPVGSELEKDRRELREAIEKQEFEKAAVLRDRIRELEKGESK